MKKFNTTGTCFPARHYMVDISERVEIIRKGVLTSVSSYPEVGGRTIVEAVV